VKCAPSVLRENINCWWTTQRSRNRWDLSRVEYTRQSEQRTWSFVFKPSGLKWRALRQGGGDNELKRISTERSWATTYLGDQEGDSETGRYVRRTGDQCCHWMKMSPVVRGTDDLKLPVPISHSKPLDSYVTLTAAAAAAACILRNLFQLQKTATYRQLLCPASVASDSEKLSPLLRNTVGSHTVCCWYIYNIPS
jgi:hypothetical protein